MLSANRPKLIASEKGIALVTAILACIILFALAMLVIHVSTGDLRISSKYVGDKKAMAAAETGIHRMMQNFDPQNLNSSATTSTTTGAFAISGTWYVRVDASNDPASVYNISTPATPATGPTFLPMSGYSIGGGQSWGQRRYEVNITGRNTDYNTQATVSTGVGYGPVEISTMSR